MWLLLFYINKWIPFSLRQTLVARALELAMNCGKDDSQPSQSILSWQSLITLNILKGDCLHQFWHISRTSEGLQFCLFVFVFRTVLSKFFFQCGVTHIFFCILFDANISNFSNCCTWRNKSRQNVIDNSR